MAFQNLVDMLMGCITPQSADPTGLTFFMPGNTDTEVNLSYKELYDLAFEKAEVLYNFSSYSQGSVVVLYFDNHYHSIIWFWATVLCGGVPCPCPSLSKNQEQRKLYIDHLKFQLKDPLFLTTEALHEDITENTRAQTMIVDRDYGTVKTCIGQDPIVDLPIRRTAEDVAVLMLTSGSTGRSKAVALTYRQIMAAITGKVSVRELTSTCSLLNWVGFDHVASLVEIHLQAMYLRGRQVHVNAADVVSNPTTFLRLLSNYRIERTFAPHFFLVKLKETLESRDTDLETLDLSSLRFLATGGEANSVDTVAQLSRLMSKYGAPMNAIVAGFGMTETCAGAIFNTELPNYDESHGYEFASLGVCMSGIQMRITASWNGDIRVSATQNQPGEFEITGDVVFSEYFNNALDTAASFTPDGWFKTGDWAMLDENGYLRLVGRSKETININGVKYSPHEIETAIHMEGIAGILPNYLACFHYRRNGMQTENICVVYAPSYAQDDTAARLATNNSIKRAVMLETGSVPYVLPLNEAMMPQSTLGKLSRNRIRSTFEAGGYQALEELNNQETQSGQSKGPAMPSTALQHTLVQEFAQVLGVNQTAVDVDMPMYDMGVNSIILIRFKRRIEAALDINNLPIVILMTNATIGSLAAAISHIQSAGSTSRHNSTYNPTITLQPQGSKTPLWLFHPGVGEVLVFFNLAKYLTDRPVYALRARGFEVGEMFFESIDEAVDVYYNAIKKTQPVGPYALAGYSYGAMLAFETAKRLEAEGHRVQFLGSFNLPPHIKARMRKLVWSECLLHLAYFLGLITESYSRSVADHVASLSTSEALAFVFEAADAQRVDELSLTKSGLETWTNLAFGLQSMARDYEPTGQISSIDIFCAIPLAVVAEDKETWRTQHLSLWGDFCASHPRIHDVDGSHYTMIDENNVFSFQKKFRRALKARGL